MTSGTDRRLRVLVADPDTATRNFVRLVLDPERFEVVEAGDATAAVRAVAAGVPDVLVIDRHLPGTGGLVAARAIRSQPQTADVRVLLLHDLGDPVSEQEAASSRIDATLARPLGAFPLHDAVVGLVDAR